MRTYIKKLQSKTEGTRKQILFGSLLICMSFVFLVWINSIGYKLNKESSAKVQEDIKPFALFGKTLTDTYDSVTASVGNISPSQKEEELKEELKEELEIEKQIDLIPIE